MSRPDLSPETTAFLKTLDSACGKLTSDDPAGELRASIPSLPQPSADAGVDDFGPLVDRLTTELQTTFRGRPVAFAIHAELLELDTCAAKFRTDVQPASLASLVHYGAATNAKLTPDLHRYALIRFDQAIGEVDPKELDAVLYWEGGLISGRDFIERIMQGLTIEARSAQAGSDLDADSTTGAAVEPESSQEAGDPEGEGEGIARSVAASWDTWLELVEAGPDAGETAATLVEAAKGIGVDLVVADPSLRATEFPSAPTAWQAPALDGLKGQEAIDALRSTPHIERVVLRPTLSPTPNFASFEDIVVGDYWNSGDGDSYFSPEGLPVWSLGYDIRRALFTVELPRYANRDFGSGRALLTPEGALVRLRIEDNVPFPAADLAKARALLKGADMEQVSDPLCAGGPRDLPHHDDVYCIGTPAS